MIVMPLGMMRDTERHRKPVTALSGASALAAGMRLCHRGCRSAVSAAVKFYRRVGICQNGSHFFIMQRTHGAAARRAVTRPRAMAPADSGPRACGGLRAYGRAGTLR